jgi:predicted transcriptional regulator
VTLRNNVHQRKAWVDKDVTELVGTVLAASLGDRDKRILNFVAEHEEISVSEAARLANCTWHTAKRALVRLMNMGVLRSTRRPGKKHDTMARYRLHRPSS